MKSILYLTNIPAPYTVEFFNDLGKSFNLMVVFEDKNSAERDRSWEVFDAVSFKYSIIKMNKTVIPFGLQDGIKKILEEKKYDFYIVGNYSSMTGMTTINWLRKNKYPYAIHADGGIVRNESILRYSLKRHLIQNAAVYFSSGHVTTQYFIHYGAKKERIFEYPFSSVRLNQIRQDIDNTPYRRMLDLPVDQKIIVSVGQIIHRKGFDVLIRAVSKVKSNVKLYIIGGEATPDLISLIDDLQLTNVEFIRFLPFKTILNYMAAADVFVLLTREDIWGLVVNEALSMGVPIISTDKCVAAIEMIENGENGYVIKSENPELAADRIDYLLEHSDLCNIIKKNNIKKAKKYTIENMSETYCNIINLFLDKKNKV